jgi:colanic acid/amylovoran biosynthesis glycosyltransferase
VFATAEPVNGISKVAFFVNLFPKLSETFILHQITGVIKMGIDVRIYALGESDEEKVHHDVTRYDLLSRVRPARDLLTGKTRQRFDIVHCHFGTSAITACELKRRGIIEGKLLTSFHGFDVNVRYYDNNYYLPLIARGDHYTANTGYTRDRAVALGFPQNKISILHEGVDISQFSPDHTIKRDDDTIRVLTVGRLVEKKGTAYAIEAMALIRERNVRNIRLDIIGDGPLDKELEQQIRERKLEDAVALHGSKTSDEVLEFFKLADIFILPSISSQNGDTEGQGLVLQEAQAMEIPVVSTFHNGIPEGVKDTITGFLVEERNAGQLAVKILELAMNQELRLRMGKEGRLFVKQKFDIRMLNGQLLDIYEKLMQSAGSI